VHELRSVAFHHDESGDALMTTLSPTKAGDFYHPPCQESGAGMVCAAFHDLKHGTFKLSALIDSENAVSETNEKNNSAEAIVVKP
jgi:hypothetical protein